MKEKNGITLIALVITIIILIILASISIDQLTKSGLIIKAELAKEKYQNAIIDEKDILSDYENKIVTTREKSFVNGTELLKESAVAPSTTSFRDVNLDFELKDSVKNYEYLLITFGVYDTNTKKTSGTNTLFIKISELPILDDEMSKSNYFDLYSGDTLYWSTAIASFVNDTTFRIMQTCAVNSGRTHFAVTSIIGIK